MAFDLAKAAGLDKIVSNLDTMEVVMIPLDKIDQNEKNFFSVDDVQDLMESIQVNGILQPLNLVRAGDRYRIIAGHRRFKAAGLAGLKEVPAIVLPEMSEAMEWFMLIKTNTTTRELSHAEKAEAAIRLKKHLVQMKQEGVKITGRLRDIVSEQLEISKTELADKIKGGTLTLGGSSATTQSGQLLVKNASNVNMLKLNKDGIVVKSGHLAVASDFANSTYNWSTNTWTTTTNTSQLDLGDDYIRMGVYSPSGYSNYMRLLDNGLHFQGNAQGIGSWGSFIGHDDYGDFVIQDTVRGYMIFKGPDDDTELANISGSGLRVSGVYSNTIASSANVHIDSYGQFYKSTSSSQRYKTDIQDIQSEELNPERLYDLPVREFKFKEGYLSDEDSCANTFVPGFIAEEVAEVYPIACEYDGDNPENWNIRFIVPAMLKLIQDQKKEIEALKEQINNKAVN